jgi:hypothetical protein
MSDPERGIMLLSKTPEPALSAAASKFLKLRARIVPFGSPNPRCVPHAPSELLAQNEKNPISGSAASFQYESVGRGCLRSQLSRSLNRSPGGIRAYANKSFYLRIIAKNEPGRGTCRIFNADAFAS